MFRYQLITIIDAAADIMQKYIVTTVLPKLRLVWAMQIRGDSSLGVQGPHSLSTQKGHVVAFVFNPPWINSGFYHTDATLMCPTKNPVKYGGINISTHWNIMNTIHNFSLLYMLKVGQNPSCTQQYLQSFHSYNFFQFWAIQTVKGNCFLFEISCIEIAAINLIHL